jgi:DNA-binding transcriptional ArsR family regulator
MGDPARAEALTAMLAGRALSATELALVARVTRSTMSVHLDKLLQAGLVAAERQGRHKYFRLAHPDVAQALESLLGLAERSGSGRPRPAAVDPALRRARVCYDHLAGELSVGLYDRLWSRGALAAPRGTGAGPQALVLTPAGERLFRGLGVDVAALRARRRPLCRACLDWSERRHHLAGALGAALLGRAFELRWAWRARAGRAVTFSAAGEAALRRALGA